MLPPGELSPAPLIDMVGYRVLAADGAIATLQNFGSGGASYAGATVMGAVYMRAGTPPAPRYYLDFNNASVKVGRFSQRVVACRCIWRQPGRRPTGTAGCRITHAYPSPVWHGW
jgi:hypothetical protein